MAKRIKMWTKSGHDKEGLEYLNINFGRITDFVAYDADGRWKVQILTMGYEGYWLDEEFTDKQTMLNACEDFLVEHSAYTHNDIIH